MKSAHYEIQLNAAENNFLLFPGTRIARVAAAGAPPPRLLPERHTDVYQADMRRGGQPEISGR